MNFFDGGNNGGCGCGFGNLGGNNILWLLLILCCCGNGSCICDILPLLLILSCCCGNKAPNACGCGCN